MIWFWVVVAVLIALAIWMDVHAHANTDRFQKVDEHVYRGSQPESIADYFRLKDAGIKTILNLREKEFAEEEKVIAELMGFEFFNVPMTGMVYPGEYAVRYSQNVLRAPHLQPVFVHCTYGKDRTGMVVGMYRRLNNGWTRLRAWREMWQIGFNPVNFGMLIYFWFH